MADKNKDRTHPTFIEEARRKQIIASTILTLAKRGFVNTSLADIADQIGVTKGVISYHFDGKDDLINGCPLDAVTPDVWRLLHIVSMKPILPLGGNDCYGQ